MAKFTAADIKAATAKAPFQLSDAEVARLVEGKVVPLTDAHLRAMTAPTCSGLKIIDLGGGCGVYINIFPPSINVCCQT